MQRDDYSCAPRALAATEQVGEVRIGGAVSRGGVPPMFDAARRHPTPSSDAQPRAWPKMAVRMHASGDPGQQAR